MKTDTPKEATSFLLQVKDRNGRWKTIRKNDDADYLKLVGDRHFSRFDKRRVISAGQPS